VVDTHVQMLSVPSAGPRLSRSAVASGAVLLLAAAFIAVLTSSLGGVGGPRAVSDFGLMLAALGAGVACFLRARHELGRERLFWRLIGTFALSWGIGQTIWTWYEIVQGREVPFPSLADAGYLLAVPFAAAAMLMLPTGTAAGRARTLIDGAMIAGSALLTSWVFVLRIAFEQDGSLFSHTISLLYPIGDVIVVTIVLYSVLRARQAGMKTSAPILLIGAGLLGFAFSDSAFTYLTATNTYSSGSLIDIGWFCGFTLILLASLQHARIVEFRSDPAATRLSGMWLPYAAVIVALASSSFELIRTGNGTSFVSWVRTAMIVAIVIRQVLTLRENRSLTGRLEGRLHDLRASEQRFEALVQHSSDVVSVVDPDGIVTYQSESIQGVFGYGGEDLQGTCLADILEQRSGERFLHAVAEVASEKQGVRVLELEVRHSSGRLCHAEMTMTNLLANPSVGGIVLNTRDMSERKVLQDQLVHEASHDSLTALANRSLFRDRVEKELRQNNDRQARLTILFLDLDGFKEVNDSLGHATGDVLLIQVAERLRSCVRPIDTVARLGGDEFAVLVADKSSERDGATVADRIVRALRDPFKLEGREIYVGASIGIAATDHDVDDADHLLRNADLAMYRAKAGGAGGYERYHPRLHVALVERLQLEAELRQALAAGDLEFHYQPTLSLATGQIQGVEALARWKHPRQGYISPGEFIPLAEQTGLIRRLGCWGLTEACRRLADWHERFPAHAGMTVSVNISGRHLEDASLIDDVQEALAKSGLEPRYLVLEMTESVLMDHTEENVELLGRLKELGVGLAIDDFGTGYSSLAYLHRFPADVIKIDRSFVERLGGSESDAELLRTIVQLGQSLRMVTVAEGVETEEQALALEAMGCELAQGFHFHRALAREHLEQLLGPATLKPVRAGLAAA
jgi:diguanylate cyclase (GGDEF)-like protein/PAS domain S-box-containing protein